MEGEIYRFIMVWLSILASLCYCYFIVSNIPKGTLRLLSLFPVLCLFSILPLFLTTVLLTGITAFFITWLANFKLVLFAFDLGPLSSEPPKSLPLFISITCFPIKIKPDMDSNPKTHHPHPSSDIHKSQKLHLNLPTKILIFALNIGMHDFYKQQLHPNVVLVLYCCMLYLFVDTTLGLCNVVLSSLITGMELELPSNEPYFATSLQDFWGRRWNLMVTHILRHTIYLPIRSIAGTIIKARWGPLFVAVLATFLVSGLMHELLFFYVTRATPTWEVTWFFVLHGLCLVLELGLKKRGGDKWGLHWALSGPIAVSFVVVTASWLFFPPLLRNGVEERAIREYKSLVSSIKSNLG